MRHLKGSAVEAGYLAGMCLQDQQNIKKHQLGLYPGSGLKYCGLSLEDYSERMYDGILMALLSYS